MKDEEKKFLEQLDKKFETKDFDSIKEKIRVEPIKSAKTKGFIFGSLITAGTACLAIGATFIAINVVRKSPSNIDVNSSLINSIGEKEEESVNDETKYLDGKYRIIEVSDTVGESNNDYYIVKHWDEREIYEKYTSVKFNNINYNISSSAALGTLPVEATYIGEELGEAIARGYDDYALTEEERFKECPVKIYEIKKICSDLAFAVKFDGNENFYPYLNIECKFSTIGDFLAKSNFLEYGNIGESVYYPYRDSTNKYRGVFFENIDKQAIIDTFLKDENVELTKEIKVRGDVYYSISIGMKILGLDNLSFAIGKNGYVQTNLFGSAYCFYIGNEVANNFFNYLEENYEGVVYIVGPFEPSSSNEGGGSGGVTVSYPVEVSL